MTQCFTRGCLQVFPGNSPDYQIQGKLLGEDYLKQRGLTPEAPGILALSPVVTRWLADKTLSADLLRLLGEPIRGTSYDASLGRDITVFQMAVVSSPPPGEAVDIGDVRVEPLGAWMLASIEQEPRPWWTNAWVMGSLLAASSAASLVSILKGIFAGEAGGAF